MLNRSIFALSIFIGLVVTMAHAEDYPCAPVNFVIKKRVDKSQSNTPVRPVNISDGDLINYFSTLYETEIRQSGLCPIEPTTFNLDILEFYDSEEDMQILARLKVDRITREFIDSFLVPLRLSPNKGPGYTMLGNVFVKRTPKIVDILAWIIPPNKRQEYLLDSNGFNYSPMLGSRFANGREIFKAVFENMSDYQILKLLDHNMRTGYLRRTQFTFGDVTIQQLLSRGESLDLSRYITDLRYESVKSFMVEVFYAFTEVSRLRSYAKFAEQYEIVRHINMRDTNCVPREKILKSGKKDVIHPQGQFFPSIRKIALCIDNSGGKEIPKAASEVLLHELGHAFQYAIPKSVFDQFKNLSWVSPAWWSFSSEETPVADSKKFISEYAQTDAGEDFAESFARYIDFRKDLEEIPEKLQFFDTLSQCLFIPNVEQCMKRK